MEESMGSQITGGLQYDIFLSHSGEQKGFVNNLYSRLKSFYRVFFDSTHHSLPPAEKFPPLIFEAADKCKLAVVVLSNDFLMSYWPMLELCAFVRAGPSVKILPLFYLLSPSDLKNEDNLKKWREAWSTHAAKQANSKHTVNVLEWENALKVLCSQNGIDFNPSRKGEQDYLEEIVSKISKTIPPSIKYDDTNVQGKVRLCNIILAEFGELEARMLQPCNEQSVPSQPRVYCLLAMYGLPGSGKSTICKCLRDYYFQHFDGKAHYIVLPTNPTREKIAEVCKGLLDKLTNFRNMIDLTCTSDLAQVYYAFKTSNLQSSRIFLVLDNISTSMETLEFVEMVLEFGVGPGSKVLLVARTPDVLQSFLNPERKQSRCVSAIVNVPSLNEKEAIGVLLQSRDNEDLEDRDFTTHDTQIMEKVVYMSGFGPKHQRLYLPLVLRLMGDQLRRYNLHVEQWGRAMEDFWVSIEKCKERAVMELVKDCFLQLADHLQLLFLDLALFIQRLPTVDHGSWQTCDILSIMHDRSPTDISMDMYELQRHCFVEDAKDPSMIHDVFLEFAASIPESSQYYYVSSSSCIHIDQMLPRPGSQARKFGLRAVVVEELSEAHKRFDFWPEFPKVEALVLRNCKKLAVLGLKGVISLSILYIDSCPGLKSVELPACEADCSNLLDSTKWLRWVDREGGKNMVKQHKMNNTVQMYAEQAGKQLVNYAWSWFAGVIGGFHITRPARMVGTDLAFRMRRLQALDVQNTGIKHLGDFSKCWPLLQEITIIEKSLEHVEVGTLPCLKRITLLCDDEKEESCVTLTQGVNSSHHKFRASPRGFKTKNLLGGCPALEVATLRSVSFEDGLGTLGTPKLNELWLANSWHADKLPNLEACAKSLERLVAHGCRELRSVEFVCLFERLNKLYLVGCPNITEVSGLDCLPRLYELCIQNCKNLQTLRGLSGLVSLRSYFVGSGCPNLQVSLRDLEGVSNQLFLLDYHSNNLQRELEGFTVLNFVEAKQLHLFVESPECLPVVPYCDTLVDLTTLVGVLEPPHLSSLRFICDLGLKGVQNLASLRGIEFLHPLEGLQLKSLQNLSCLQGIESLTNLRRLLVADCTSVEELPSLSQLVNMQRLVFENCVKLRSVEGCDAMTHSCPLAPNPLVPFYGCTMYFIGCKSMTHFPLEGCLLTRDCQSTEVHVYGSKFASREVLLSWVMGDCELQKAAVEALKWELCRSRREKPTELMELAGWLLERIDRSRIRETPWFPFWLQPFLYSCEQVALGNNECLDAYELSFQEGPGSGVIEHCVLLTPQGTTCCVHGCNVALHYSRHPRIRCGYGNCLLHYEH